MQNPLWQRLAQFDLDGGVPWSFSRRLARDNGWTHDFSLRVCEEYKKFLYLACTAGHVVSPSEEVDQAWHLHLTYTRSYWEELCPKVLGMPLHHDPARGRKAEVGKFENLYEQTLKSYREAFGHEPPLDIWPPTSIRFGHARHFRRVNLKRHYVIAKPRFSGSSFKMAPALVLAVVLAGCSATGSFNPFNWYGGEFLFFFWCLSGVAALLYLGICWLLRLPDDDVFPNQPLDPYLLARLGHPGELPIDAALCALRQMGAIEADANSNIRRVQGGPIPTHPFERRVWEEVGGYNRLPRVHAALKGVLEDFDRQLRGMGLIVNHDQKWNSQVAAWGLTLFLLAVGGTKIVIGMQRDRPVGFLIFSCFAVILLTTWLVSIYNPHRTRRGERYLNSLRQTVRGARTYDPSLAAGSLVFGAALWGYGELETYGFADFRRQLPSGSTSSGSGDTSSSGCGGSSGGGGGGCGGCGGGD